MNLVYVSQGDIDRGKRCSSTECPIALAVRRAFDLKDDDEVYVETAIELCIGRRWTLWSLPSEALKFIQDFDRGQQLAPFSFRTRVGR